MSISFSAFFSDSDLSNDYDYGVSLSLCFVTNLAFCRRTVIRMTHVTKRKRCMKGERKMVVTKPSIFLQVMSTVTFLIFTINDFFSNFKIEHCILEFHHCRFPVRLIRILTYFVASFHRTRKLHV